MTDSAMPLVSVIIPTHNRAHCVRRSIESVLHQNWVRLEVIVVDDASTDDTAEVVAGIGDSRIKYVRLDVNQGVAGARNAGIDVAEGDFIAFQDSDDEWLSGKLAKQIRAFSGHSDGVDAVFCGFIRFYSQSPEYIPTKQIWPRNADLASALLIKNFITPQTLVLRRSCLAEIGGFDARFGCFEDWDIAIRLVADFRVGFVDEPLAIVYETPGSLLSMSDRNIDFLEQFLDKHRERFSRHRRILADHQRWLGHARMMKGQTRKGQTHLLRALALNPLHTKALVSLVLSLSGGAAYQGATRAFRWLRDGR